MDLLRAHEVLSHAPQDTEDLNQRKEKTEACRVIADQVCSPAFRYSFFFKLDSLIIIY